MNLNSFARDKAIIRQFWEGLAEILAPLESTSADTLIPLQYYPEVDDEGIIVGIRAADDLEGYEIIDDLYVIPANESEL